MKTMYTPRILTFLAVALTATTSLARNDAASEQLGLKLGLQCYTFRALTFMETVDKAAELGIRYLEIYPGQTLEPGSKEKISEKMSAETIAKIQKKLADAGGLKIVAYGVAKVPTEEAAARKHFEWAKQMGIEVLTTESIPNEVHDKLTKEFGIRLALHNHPATWGPDAVLAACQERGTLIGACCDTAHQYRAGRQPVAVLKQLEGRIMSLHFKDLSPAKKDVPFGQGACDVQGMLAELKRQGFKGYLVIEYEVGSLPELMTNVGKCVDFFDRTCAALL